MAMTRSRRSFGSADYWPGFVDAMATLLLVVTFLLSMFMLTQYFVQQESSGKDTALKRLNRQIAQLTEALALEQTSKQSLEDRLSALTASLATAQDESAKLRSIAENIERQKKAKRRAAELAVQNAAGHEIQRSGDDAGPDDRREQQPHRCSEQHQEINPAAGDGLGMGLVSDQGIGR